LHHRFGVCVEIDRQPRYPLNDSIKCHVGATIPLSEFLDRGFYDPEPPPSRRSSKPDWTSSRSGNRVRDAGFLFQY
jgi:hypothetical protein